MFSRIRKQSFIKKYSGIQKLGTFKFSRRLFTSDFFLQIQREVLHLVRGPHFRTGLKVVEHVKVKNIRTVSLSNT